MYEKPDLETRVRQFNMLQLPGQPMGMHMGTSYLVGDLWSEVKRLRAALEPFRKVAEAHDVWEAERDGSPLLIEHCEGGQEYDITLGDLRRVREILSPPL